MNEQSRQSAPPYREEDATRWLAFLARGMTKHDQTIFLIEKLQPSWLSARWQRWVYIMASRMLWGILGGLIFGLIGGLSYGLIGEAVFEDFGQTEELVLWLLDGLIYGLGVGLFIGLIDAIRITNQHIQTRQNKDHLLRKIIGSSAICTLIFWLIQQLLFWLIQQLPLGLDLRRLLELSVGLILGLAVGAIWVIRGRVRSFGDEIETVETIEFRKRSLLYGCRNGLIVVLINILIVGPALGLTIGFTSEDVFMSEDPDRIFFGFIFMLVVGLVTGLVVGLILGVVIGLLSSFQPAVKKLKTMPNQGVRLSLLSAGLMGGVGGVTIVVIAVPMIGDLVFMPAYGMLGGLCIALWYGGLDVLQHFLVRFLLWRSGSLPWRLAPFLDYAAEELHFLQKVGGGYIFVHRYLLEHFAAMETDDGRSVSAD